MARKKKTKQPRKTKETKNADPIRVEVDYPVPEGARISRHNDYLRLDGMDGHPLAGVNGSVPYHRYVCHKALGGPSASECHHCGYPIPWKSSLTHASFRVVNVDHLDADKENNAASNLVPSCYWCNSNRWWAEAHEGFWSNWKRWMAEVPPQNRPNLAVIAAECCIGPFYKGEGAA